MPVKDKAEYNEYMRKYMLRRYYKRRAKAIEQLGGYCIECGSTENLEFDHWDRNEKLNDIGKMFTSASEEKLQAELVLCVLRCRSCHQLKTTLERDQIPAALRHGTLSSYRYCKCDLCKDANNRYHRDYRINRGS